MTNQEPTKTAARPRTATDGQVNQLQTNDTVRMAALAGLVVSSIVSAGLAAPLLATPLLASLAPPALVAAIEVATPTAAETKSDDAKASPVTGTEPADGEVLTRPVRALRVWFRTAPDVATSSLSLEGPNGPLSVEGLHSMGDDDLMARVVGPMPDGKYTATWTTGTQASDDQGSADQKAKAGSTRTGTWSFEIKRSSP